MKSKRRICIATIDPSQVGGVTTTKEYFCKMSKRNGYEPYIAFFPLDPNLSVRFKNIFSFKRIKIFIESKFLNFQSYSIGALFPEFEFMHYLSSFWYWKKVLKSADICFGVSGTNQCCLPYVLSKKNFSCWIATTYYEDRKHNIISLSPVQKLLNILSLPIIIWFEGLIYRKAQRILVLSQYTKDMILKKYHINDSKIMIVPYPIDTEVFKPSNDKHAGIKILFVGRINDPRKNITMLMRAFSKLDFSDKDIELWLIGEEPSITLKNLTFELGISKQVNFFGSVFQDDILNYYKSCDIFALPSYQEGLGIVILEAMSCSLPVVLTKCGGPEWLVENDVNSLIVENGNTEQFTSALSRLIVDEKLRHQIGEEARRTIIERCSTQSLEKIFVNALEELSDDRKNIKNA